MTAQEMRAKAEEFGVIARNLKEQPEVDATTTAAVVAAVVAQVYPALADIMEMIEVEESPDKKLVRRNSILRIASAKGDWNEVSRILAESAAGSSSSNSSTSSQ